MQIVEKEGHLPVFVTDILNFFFLSPTVEINVQLTSKIGENFPIAEGLRGYPPWLPHSIHTTPYVMKSSVHWIE